MVGTVKGSPQKELLNILSIGKVEAAPRRKKEGRMTEKCERGGENDDRTR